MRPSFDREVAAFVLADYMAHLPTWSLEDGGSNLADVRKLADDLGIRLSVENEACLLGFDEADYLGREQ